MGRLFCGGGDVLLKSKAADRGRAKRARRGRRLVGAGWPQGRAGECRGRDARRAPRRSRGRRPPAAETVRRTVCPAGAGPVGAGGGRGERAGRRPGGTAADTGGARVFRRSRNGLRPPAGPLHKKAAHRLPLSRARALQMCFQITFCFSHFPLKYRGR